jgi:hypothetical protein
VIYIGHMFKYTKYLLDKIEAVFKELEYNVRYEKGNFQSGYCIVDELKIVVINKFFNTEARINCLLEILDKIKYDAVTLSESSQKTLKKVRFVLTSPDIPD